MKITISCILVFCLFTGKELLAQDPDITGTWTMFEMTWTTGDQVNTTTEEQMKDNGMTTEYYFKPDGELKLISNMAMGSGEMETMEGTWKLEGDQLTYGFVMDGVQRDFVWGFEFKDDVIHLERSSPDGSTTVVNSLKRK
jgi:hypothetical protein